MAPQTHTSVSPPRRPLGRLAGPAAVACALAAGLVLAHLQAGAPTERRVHVELFRYGSEPHVIRANRGDRLTLTFASRDTGHSFFLQDYDLDVKVTPGSDTVEVFRPSRPLEPPQRLHEVPIMAGRPGLSGWLCAKSRWRCHVYCGPLHGFEQGDLVVSPNPLLWTGMTLLAVIVLGACSRCGRDPAAPAGTGPTPTTDLLARSPRWRGWLRLPWLPVLAWLPMIALLDLVLLCGLLGTKVAGRNFAGMGVWVLWLGLLVLVLVPFGGRVWCLLCPLPVIGEWLRGPGPARRPAWPAWLFSAWPRTLLFLLLGTFSTQIAGVPRLTAVLLLALLLVATALTAACELRTFCRGLCPISAFLSLYGQAGRLGIRQRDRAVCERCTVGSCRTGSEAGPPCPYGLRVGDIAGNRDCGVCLACLRTCAYDNATLVWQPWLSGPRTLVAAEAWQAIVLLVLGVSYCLTHLGPWPFLRDAVDLVDKGNWGLFAGYAGLLWVTALVAAPALVAGLAWLGRRWSRADAVPLADLFAALALALVPMGLMLWVAFAIEPAMVHATFVASTLSDPFGWNWNLFGTAGAPWHQVWPALIPWLQVAAVLTGANGALRRGLVAWTTAVGDSPRAGRGFAPAAVAIAALAAALVAFFAN